MDAHWVRASGWVGDGPQAFETWVKASLNDRYGSVTDERVPDEWLHLINADT